MTHRREVPAGAEKFLTPQQRKRVVASWKKGANKREANGHLNYASDRVETRDGYFGAIDTFHGLNFSVIEYLRRLIDENKKRHEDDKGASKIKVLDLGGGTGMFAHQLRKEFGSDIKVYTTGLRKKAARRTRAAQKDSVQSSPRDVDNFGDSYLSSPEYKEVVKDAPNKLHPNDLKWRSITELSDFPEFDFIIDTFGEAVYADKSLLPRYLMAVIKKLKPGGKASLFTRKTDYSAINRIIAELDKEMPNTFDCDFNHGDHGFVLEINKLKKQPEIIKPINQQSNNLIIQ